MAGPRSGVVVGVRPGQLWWQVPAVVAGMLRAARARLAALGGVDGVRWCGDVKRDVVLAVHLLAVSLEIRAERVGGAGVGDLEL